jgi:hypothetical protein
MKISKPQYLSSLPLGSVIETDLERQQHTVTRLCEYLQGVYMLSPSPRRHTLNSALKDEEESAKDGERLPQSKRPGNELHGDKSVHLFNGGGTLFYVLPLYPTKSSKIALLLVSPLLWSVGSPKARLVKYNLTERGQPRYLDKQK